MDEMELDTKSYLLGRYDSTKELTDEEIRKAVEAEREACAKVCDDYDVAEDVNSCDTAEGIAIAIRARGQS
jgi:hypothetical protein